MLRFFSNLPVGQRISLSFGVLMLLMIVMAVSGQVAQNKVTDTAIDALEHDAEVFEGGADVQRLIALELRRGRREDALPAYFHL